MPMDFEDMDALKRSFDSPDRLPLKNGESEADYRERCAVYMETVWQDTIEAHEIRTGKGWDKWGRADQTDLLRRRGFQV
jgi:hypothetical protein